MAEMGGLTNVTGLLNAVSDCAEQGTGGLLASIATPDKTHVDMKTGRLISILCAAYALATHYLHQGIFVSKKK